MNLHTHQPQQAGVVTKPAELIVRIHIPRPGFVEVTDGRRLHLNPQPKPQHWLSQLLRA